MKNYSIPLLSVLGLISSNLSSQIPNNVINIDNRSWPAKFEIVGIKSTTDGTIQKAWFYKSGSDKKQPLVVSLHTWSGDYSQEDPLTKEILLRDWNYIHPDFRGVNNRPQACGSDLVISDILDAINYAVKNSKTDTSDVHIIGVSGGGYVTLVAFMKLNYPVKSFNAWASISNLNDWYFECKDRGLKYTNDLEMITTSGNGFDKSEALKRSPVVMEYNKVRRKGSSINIYAGINDGYTGSVPISQSINMFNKLLKDMYPDRMNEIVPDSIKNALLARKINPSPENSLKLGGRKIHLFKKLSDLSLTIFEGTHEMLVPQALALMPSGNRLAIKINKLNILTIGDSNGAGPDGWPEQLKKLLPYSTIINKSISGNTIGFDNNGQANLNTVKNIDSYLEETYNQVDAAQQIDIILINLGTNDTKVIFNNQQKEVPENMSLLIQKIRIYQKNNNKKLSKICIITPSPMDEEKVNKEKYGGGDERIRKNNILFKKIANRYHIDVLDTYSQLKNDFAQKTSDGVHLDTKTQFQLATIIASYLDK
jgi:lysophospholipase L1-like esterase